LREIAQEIAQACLLATPELKMARLGNLSRQEKLNHGHGIMNGFPTVLHIFFQIHSGMYIFMNYKIHNSIYDHFTHKNVLVGKPFIPCPLATGYRKEYTPTRILMFSQYFLARHEIVGKEEFSCLQMGK
jgi:hypothetical protein